MIDLPPGPPPNLHRGPGDGWVMGPDGQRFWGKFGAAGLLLVHPESGVLLQHRVAWSHFGGTWGIPGGARQPEESAAAGAVREAVEEAGVPAELVRVDFESVLDLGWWSYTTVVGHVADHFEPAVTDAESLEVRWVSIAEVDSLELHPGFADAWPRLRPSVEEISRRLAGSA
ncbi:NUDIX hydrolase [Gryllotalpicola sp.]|uniref:NUDIX domain-containing protein n=1 Tax=Gryllotalpicola sp. TaxID=1932787 RepID=UPI0026137335|nr:NUDIX hydrolase [Gryllotalpicola sp.]